MNCMKASDQTNSNVAYDEIAKVAYYLWEQAGRPDGRALEHWLEAEARMRAGCAGAMQMRTSPVPTEPTRSAQSHVARYGLVLRPGFLI
jgi:hypothetical protein